MRPGLTRAENAALAGAKRRIRELEEEVRILVRARARTARSVMCGFSNRFWPFMKQHETSMVHAKCGPNSR